MPTVRYDQSIDIEIWNDRCILLLHGYSSLFTNHKTVDLDFYSVMAT